MIVREISPWERYDFIVNEYENTYRLDLSRLADGLYTVEYNGESLTCYCTKASFIRRVPLLILEIFIGARCRSISGGKDGRWRSVYW